MFLTVIFSLLFLRTASNQYQDAMKICGDAYYQGSEFKQLVDEANQRLKKDQPVLTFIGATGYTIGVKHQVQVRSTKVALPGTTTTYQYDNNQRSGSVGFEWRF